MTNAVFNYPPQDLSDQLRQLAMEGHGFTTGREKLLGWSYHPLAMCPACRGQGGMPLPPIHGSHSGWLDLGSQHGGLQAGPTPKNSLPKKIRLGFEPRTTSFEGPCLDH